MASNIQVGAVGELCGRGPCSREATVLGLVLARLLSGALFSRGSRLEPCSREATVWGLALARLPSVTCASSSEEVASVAGYFASESFDGGGKVIKEGRN